jgi:PAS domain S-box-containing protein
MNFLDDLSNVIDSKFFNESPCSAFIWKNDEKQTIQRASENITTLLGYAKSDFISNKEKYFNLIHPDDRRRVLNKIKENHLSFSKEFIQEPYRVKSKENNYIWLEDKTVAIYENKKLTYYITYISNCTKEIEYKEKLESQNKKLDLEKSKVSTILRNIPDLLWIKDIDGKYLSCNKRFEDFFGAKEEDIVGKTDYDFTDKKTADFFRQHDKSALQSDVPLTNFEEIIFSSDNHKEYLQTTKSKIIDSNGKLLGILGIGRDLTKRKLFEEQLIHEKNRSNHYLDIVGNIIIALDDKGIITLINQAGCKILEESEDEIVGKNWFDNYLISDQIEFVKDVFIKIIKGELDNVKYVENSIKTKTGKEYIIAWHNSVSYDEDGNVTGLLSSGTDITKQKEADNKILKQKEELQTIFDYSQDGIAVLDLESNFLNFNSAYLKFSGYTREELLTKSCLDLTIPEDRIRAEEAIAYAIEYGHLNNFEKTCIGKNNKRINVNMAISLLPDKKSLLIVTKDITTMKILEKQSRLASMGEMIGNIAHQWRQPLSVITTSASGIKLNYEMDILNKDFIDNSVDLIINQSKYLSNTIDNFRNFIKGEKIEGVISVKEILDSALLLTEASFKNNYINLLLDINYDLTIKGNKNELIEAFVNILNNAKDVLKKIKNEEDRLIYIQTKEIEKDKKVKILIKDSAGGIDEKVLLRIFEPYFTTKHKSQGTGLGLALTDRIIRERHNGEINAFNDTIKYNNKEFIGACFSITLNK